MASYPENRRAVRFDSFEMDLIARELRKSGRKVKLQDQPFRILEHLALRSKEPVLREELYACLSAHNSYDSKHGLDNAVEKIRKALGDSVECPRFIETLRGRGYRFLREVELIPQICSTVNHTATVAQDLFLAALKQLRAGFLATNIPHELTVLFHRLNTLLDQNPTHPNRSEGCVLLESIQAARSQQNSIKHRISFESAALVFEDPCALSIYRSSADDGETWHTLGRVQGSLRLSRRRAVILVTHQMHGNEKRILSARKATFIERTVYDQTRKKTDQ